MSTKHTPGPWTLDPDAPQLNPYWYGAALRAETLLVCRLDMTNAHNQGEGNARLIAAAPDLLAACQALIYTDDLQKAIDLARAAIAKVSP